MHKQTSGYLCIMHNERLSRFVLYIEQNDGIWLLFLLKLHKRERWFIGKMKGGKSYEQSVGLKVCENFSENILSFS